MGEEELLAGDRVRLVGLKTPGMNGLTGTVTAKNEEFDRWHVWLDGDQGEKLLRAANLELILGEDSVDEGGNEGEEQKDHKPGYYIAGTWNKWANPLEMWWDEQDLVYKYRVALGEDGWESFQIWLDGNFLHALHPKKATNLGCHYSESLVDGPDADGLGKNWTIGHHRSDKAQPGEEYIVRLFEGKAGDFRVDWVRANAPAKPAKPKPKLAPAEPKVATQPPADPPERLAPATVPTPARVAQVAKPAPEPTLPPEAKPLPEQPKPAREPKPAPEPLPAAPSVQPLLPAAAAASAPSAPSASSSSSPPPWPISAPNQNMVLFLQDARPKWSENTIAVVLEKLERVKIDNVVALVLAVKEKGVWKNGGLNRKLDEVGEEGFSEATLKALRDTADKLESRTKPGQAKPKIKMGVAAAARASASEAAASVLAAKAPPPKAAGVETPPNFDIEAAVAAAKQAKGVGKGKATATIGRAASKAEGRGQAAGKAGEDERLASELEAAIAAIAKRSSVQEFRVVDAHVEVHAQPAVDSEIIDVKAQGTVVTAAEETFDGWARLHLENGWVHKERLIPHGDEVPFLALPEASRTVGWPQKFEVVLDEVPVCQAPSRSTDSVLSIRRRGEQLLADAQSYNGWVHLLDGGWVPSADPGHGLLLRCSGLREENAEREEIMEARTVLQREVPELLATNNELEYNQGLAKQRGWSTYLAELEAKDAARRKFRAQILQAKGDAFALAECMARASKAGYADEAAVAKAWQKQAKQVMREAASGHAVLLEELSAAAASGDLQAFAAAREAAKAAGVPKKEIARALALANSA